jgi:hypothetical protein
MQLSPLCTRLLGSMPFQHLLVACKSDLKAIPMKSKSHSTKLDQLTFTNALAALDRRVPSKWVLSDIGAAVKCGVWDFFASNLCECKYFPFCL